MRKIMFRQKDRKKCQVIHVKITGHKRCMKKIKEMKSGLEELRNIMEEINQNTNGSDQDKSIQVKFESREIGKAISEFARKEKEEAKAAIEKEKNIVCINPESYIAKEIKYQTALIHEVLQEIREKGR